MEATNRGHLHIGRREWLCSGKNAQKWCNCSEITGYNSEGMRNICIGPGPGILWNV